MWWNLHVNRRQGWVQCCHVLAGWLSPELQIENILLRSLTQMELASWLACCKHVTHLTQAPQILHVIFFFFREYQALKGIVCVCMCVRHVLLALANSGSVCGQGSWLIKAVMTSVRSGAIVVSCFRSQTVVQLYVNGINHCVRLLELVCMDRGPR